MSINSVIGKIEYRIDGLESEHTSLIERIHENIQRDGNKVEKTKLGWLLDGERIAVKREIAFLKEILRDLNGGL